MSIKSRLDRLEANTGEKRCDNCRGWRPTRVVYLTNEAGKTYAGKSFSEDGAAQPPAECPVCGWQPITIEVRYVNEPIK